jgi:DNA-binding response OmpR family regulator
MAILIAEDDPVSRTALELLLRHWGHEVIVTHNGAAAWEALRQPQPPALAILDWMMPALDGLEVCRRVRALPRAVPTYLILLTACSEKEALAVALEEGADDYLTKPFDSRELKARVGVGLRVVALQQGLADRVGQLEDALAQVKQLQGLLPICAYCKKIRDGQDYWQRVEDYLGAHAEVRFTHGICPSCLEDIMGLGLEDRQG